MGAALKTVGFTFLLLLCHLASRPGVDSYMAEVWSGTQPGPVQGLQSLWAEWNKSRSPLMESNLLNWKSGDCKTNKTICPCFNPQAVWRGITCLRFNNSAKCNGKCTIRWDNWIVGLELSNASLVGTLPRGAIGKISFAILRLSLTGNPNLTGTLDAVDLLVHRPSINTLDLHDNGFYGPIPTSLANVSFLQKLDLSGNQLTGEFPNKCCRGLKELLDFRVARNKLNGNIKRDTFMSSVQLATVPVGDHTPWDLSRNNFTGSPPNFSDLSVLTYLNLSYNSFTVELLALSGNQNTWLPRRTNSQLGVLDLSGLNIGGRLPDWKSSPNLISIEQLYMDKNGLSGELDLTSIQSALANLEGTSAHPLRMLSLMNNDISDVIFNKSRLTDGQILIYLQGNPYCNDTSKDPDGRSCFCNQYCAISPEVSPKSYAAVIAITTSICGFLLGSVILVLVFVIKRKNRDMNALLKKFEESEVSAKRFEYSDLRTATKSFAEERKLGKGAFGAVYKGILPNGSEIAVKQLIMKTQADFKKVSEDFLKEILLITNLQHRNLVTLKGYSFHGQEMLLVYDYVDHCDLEKLLFDSSTNGEHKWGVVSWAARMKICLGVARGLYYLHASSQTRIIHRDIKASNILLDKKLNPKIADFGLARPLDDEKTETTTAAAGTIGYWAPEYVLYRQLSEKADVFSFGVLLLEIVSRKRNRDSTRSEDDYYLPLLSLRLHEEDRLMEAMDPELDVSSEEAKDEVRRVLETALMCVHSAPEQRPTMFQVMALLTGDKDREVLIDQNDGFSEIS